MAWILPLDASPDQLFGLAVGHRNQGLVGFVLGGDARLKVTQRQPAGQVGGFDSKVQVVAQRFRHGFPHSSLAQAKRLATRCH